jgi:hypothetical protein
MNASPFTRARIVQLCDQALRRSGALGVLPTPLDAVLETAGVRDRVDLARIPGRPPAAERTLGAVWFEERALFVDRRQSEPRRRFTEAHEAVHLLCPWHAAALRLDTAAELFGPLVEGIEAEANFGAGQLIFQGGAFHAEALGRERSLSTPFALAARFGASRHAAAHHYVEAHPAPVALVVAGRWPGAGDALPVWRSIQSESFLRRFGRVSGCLPGGRLAVLEGPLADAIDEARRSSHPVAVTVRLADRGGRRRELQAEVFNNRHCHLVFFAERERLAAAA